MALLDSKIISKVDALFARIGRPLLLRTYPSAVSDDVAGTVVKGTPTDYAMLGSPPLEYAKGLIDGDVRRVGDCYVVIPATGLVVAPVTGHEVVIDFKTWKIESVRTHSPGERTAAYELQLRGSA